MANRMTRALQEDILTLASYDEETCNLICNIAEVELFEGVYQDIARKVYGYIRDYGEPPKDHVATLFAEELEGDDRRAETFNNVLADMHDQRETVRREFVVDKLNTFVRHQRLVAGIIEASEILQASGDIDQAEVIINKHMKARIDLFSPGLRLSDENALNFLDHPADAFPLGIEVLDDLNIGPTRKELFLFVALPKRGKTWMMVNVGKQGMIRRAKVLHVTLEMSEEKMAQRYFQALFALPKRGDPYWQTMWEMEGDRIAEIYQDEIKPSMWLQHEGIKTYLKGRIDAGGVGWRLFDRLIIKEFPTNGLTMNQLEAYLDNLENVEKFRPDIIIVDYPDLMKLDSANLRQDIGRLIKDLRGMGQKRDAAVVAPTQSNKEGLKKVLVDEGNAAEDFSKIFTADTVVTYNQTAEEKALGLARLFVAANRNDIDKFIVLLSQSYTSGQFVLKSTKMKLSKSYWGHVSDMLGLEEGESFEGKDDDE